MYTIDGWVRAMQYVSCAFSILVAAGTEAIVIATIGCSALMAQALEG